MIAIPNPAPVVEDTRHDGPKRRACLRCKLDFDSAWSGERVCPRCKKTSAWQSGASPRAFTPVSRR